MAKLVVRGSDNLILPWVRIVIVEGEGRVSGFIFCLIYRLNHVIKFWDYLALIVIKYFVATEDTEADKKTRKEEKFQHEEKNIPYPKQIFFIISMEACERFSYYGMNGKTLNFSSSLNHDYDLF